MSYARIFWLDDEFDFIGQLLAKGIPLGLDKDNLLARTRFAFDYEMGERIVKTEPFNLYILDGDFPLRGSPEYNEQVERFVRSAPIGLDPCEAWEIVPEDKGFTGPSVNHFAKFYDQNLRTLNQKIVVFSRSSMAPMTAFHMNIPFYSKALDTPLIKELVQDHPKEYLDWLPENYPKRAIKDIDSWETGSMEDLITRFLTKPY
ncbi:hypothetical protein J4219_08575 [Candidatus Woesearchaeota archaeon]|nr:hypothetical protein [Candidatus Woesearchaeota archaeon]